MYKFFTIDELFSGQSNRKKEITTNWPKAETKRDKTQILIQKDGAKLDWSIEVKKKFKKVFFCYILNST